MFVDTDKTYSQAFEIRKFQYLVNGKIAATIEILCFADGSFAGQGNIHIKNDIPFSTQKIFKELNATLQKCYCIIEEQIEDHEEVMETKN